MNIKFARSSAGLCLAPAARRYLPMREFPHALPDTAHDAFAFSVAADGVTVYSDSARTRGYAEAYLADSGVPGCGDYASWADFAVRGIIEGFYGNPWTMENRARVFDFMARRGMNEYFYGPKDDPFHRDRWSELYGENDAGVLCSLIAMTAERSLGFRYMLAPGLSIRYSSEADLAALEQKYAQVYSFGVRGFGLLLDDLERAKLWPEDAALYPRQVDAHVALVNRLWDFLKRLDPENSLIVCPTQYWGDLSGEYLTELGRGTDPEIELFFTGSRICSDAITTAEAREFHKNTGHTPVYWDNYPVNDAEMVDELHIGALTGREAGLGAVCGGLVANPMEYALSSLFSIGTVADYLWDSAAYDPDASYAESVRLLIGPEYIPAMRTLDRLCYKSCLTRHGHHFRYSAPLRRDPEFDAAFAAGREPLKAYLARCASELAALPGLDFTLEITRWLDAAREFCAAATDALDSSPARLQRYLTRREDIMKKEAGDILCLK